MRQIKIKKEGEHLHQRLQRSVRTQKIADRFGIALLVIHHLRKEPDDDVFSRISGTTAISGAVDSSFMLVEEKRGSGKGKLYCIGRDIEYREIELERNEDNVWELVSDSLVQPELLEARVVFLNL